MATGNAKATQLKSGETVKAGKKKHYTEPHPPNKEKQAARESGEKQFLSPVVLTVPATKIVFDEKTQQFITKAYAAPVDFLWDETRKHFVYSPRKEVRNSEAK